MSKYVTQDLIVYIQNHPRSCDIVRSAKNLMQGIDIRSQKQWLCDQFLYDLTKSYQIQFRIFLDLETQLLDLGILESQFNTEHASTGLKTYESMFHSTDKALRSFKLVNEVERSS